VTIQYLLPASRFSGHTHEHAPAHGSRTCKRTKRTPVVLTLILHTPSFYSRGGATDRCRPITASCAPRSINGGAHPDEIDRICVFFVDTATDAHQHHQQMDPGLGTTSLIYRTISANVFTRPWVTLSHDLVRPPPQPAPCCWIYTRPRGWVRNSEPVCACVSRCVRVSLQSIISDHISQLSTNSVVGAQRPGCPISRSGASLMPPCFAEWPPSSNTLTTVSWDGPLQGPATRLMNCSPRRQRYAGDVVWSRTWRIITVSCSAVLMSVARLVFSGAVCWTS